MNIDYKNEIDAIYQGNSQDAIALFDRLSAKELDALSKPDSPYKGDRLVHAAARMGDSVLMKKCVESKLNLMAMKAEGYDAADINALGLAAQETQLACLEILLANLREEEIAAEFALTISPALRVLNKLISRPKSKQTIDCLAALIKAGLDPNLSIGDQPLLSIAMMTEDLSLIKLLLQKGANPLASPLSGSTPSPLTTAMVKKRLDIVEMIFKICKVDPNCTIDVQGIKAPLIFLAIFAGDEGIYNFMLNQGADVNKPIVISSGRKLSMVSCIDLIFRASKELQQLILNDEKVSSIASLQQFRELLIASGCNPFIGKPPRLTMELYNPRSNANSNNIAHDLVNGLLEALNLDRAEDEKVQEVPIYKQVEDEETEDPNISTLPECNML